LLTGSQVPSQFGRLPGGLLQLRRQAPRRVAPAATSASSAAVPAIPEDDKKPGFLGIANITWKKILPLGFMFFCILFNYTILRDTKARAHVPLSSCTHPVLD
jgi:AAA family ATP:ADP antiporter